MRLSEDRLIYLAVGPLAAILLGAALIPMREAVAASTLEIPFILLTIVVSEFGGHPAAFVAALVSTLSLDFFMTKPYLMLDPVGKHDVTTFVGLFACGFVAAALGTRRIRRESWDAAGAERRSI